MNEEFYDRMKPVQQTVSLSEAIKLFEKGLPVWGTEYVWVYSPDDLLYSEKERGYPPAPRWYLFHKDDGLKDLYLKKKSGRWYPAPTADELAIYLAEHLQAILTGLRNK